MADKTTATKPDAETAKSKLVLHLEKIAAIKKELADEFTAKFTSITQLLEGFAPEEIRGVFANMPEEVLNKLQLQLLPVTPIMASTTSAKGKTAKGKRAPRGARGEEILKILADGKLTTGEINEKLTNKSTNLSAVLAQMKKSGKVGKTGDKWHKK